ncbi:MAG: maleylacetoacetate isomerase [Alphaproteobacteria bacterium]
MKLYSFHSSSGAYRVRIALNLKGLKAEMSFVDLTKAEQKNPAYAAVTPLMQVPALITDDGSALTSSTAIMEYLEETHPTPPLLPKTPLERARVRAIIDSMVADIAPINNLKIRKYITGELGRDEKEWIQHWTHSGLAGVEKLVTAVAGKFCFGDTPTLADCVLVPQLFHARRFGCDLSAYPTLTRIDAACNELPTFIAAQPSNQLDFKQ